MQTQNIDSRARVLATGRTGTIGQFLSSKVQSLEVDMQNINHLSVNLGGATILHLAGQVGLNKVKRDPAFSYIVNVEGTIALAERALYEGCKRFVYISTSHVYAPKLMPLKENDLIAPINEYAQQKHEAEKGITRVFESNPDQLLILRLFSILGLDTRIGTLGASIRMLLDGNSNTQIRNVLDVRDFMSPKQAAEVIEFVSTIDEIPDRIINICTQDATSVEQAICKLVGNKRFKSLKNNLIYSQSDNPYIVGNNEVLSKYHFTRSNFGH